MLATVCVKYVIVTYQTCRRANQGRRLMPFTLTRQAPNHLLARLHFIRHVVFSKAPPSARTMDVGMGLVSCQYCSLRSAYVRQGITQNIARRIKQGGQHILVVTAICQMMFLSLVPTCSCSVRHKDGGGCSGILRQLRHCGGRPHRGRLAVHHRRNGRRRPGPLAWPCNACPSQRCESQPTLLAKTLAQGILLYACMLPRSMVRL